MTPNFRSGSRTFFPWYMSHSLSVKSLKAKGKVELKRASRMVGYMLQCEAWFFFYYFISCCSVIVITIITVITFDDEIRELPNPDEKRRKLKEAAREVTGSEPRDVFLIANSIPDQEFDPAYKKEVLKMLEQALKCGERSIKMRQVQRESPKRSISEPQGRAEKSPVENTEEPNYKSWPYIVFKRAS